MTGEAVSPSEQVRAAIVGGFSRPDDIAKRTGLGVGTVQLILDHLERSGDLVRDSLASCPSSGCGSCRQATGCSGAGGMKGPRGAVLLKLTNPGRKRHS